MNNMDFILALSLDGDVLLASAEDGMAPVFNRGALKWSDLWSERDSARAQSAIFAMATTSRHVLVDAMSADGRVWDATLVAVESAGGVRQIVATLRLADPFADDWRGSPNGNEEKLRLALDGAKMGTWDLDLATSDMRCSAQCKINHGRDPTTPFSYQELAASVHPDDKLRWHETVSSAIEVGGDFEIEYRTVWPNGQPRWAYVRGSCGRSPQGNVTSMSGVSIDVTERKVIEERLRLVAVELASSDARKTEFLATLTHELRSPLAPIRNGLHVLRIADGDIATRERVRGMIERQVSQMGHLINDLMDVARIERGQIELKRKLVDLRGCARAAVETSAPAIDAKGHRLTVDTPAHAVLVDADPTRLAQMLSNLLNNAAKYTPKGGEINLIVSADADSARAQVRDNGAGISSEALAHIFDMFGQASEHMKMGSGGLGIGLALVRNLARLHGGEARGESPGPGLGATFSIDLPLSTEAMLVPAEAEFFDYIAPARRLRALIVDDHIDNAETFARVVQSMGHSVCLADRAERAIELTGSFVPEVIFVDLKASRVDVGELAAMLRRGSKDSGGAVLIALRAWDAELKPEMRESIFDHILPKPAPLGMVRDLLLDLAANRAQGSAVVKPALVLKRAGS